MSEAKLDGTNDVRSSGLLAGREASGQQDAGEAAPVLAGCAEGASERSCATCDIEHYGPESICDYCVGYYLYMRKSRIPASGPASTGHEARRQQKQEGDRE